MKNPNITGPKSTQETQDGTRSLIPSWKDGVRTALGHSKYATMFRTLYKSSKSARAAMTHFVKDAVQRELAACPKIEFDCSMDSIQQFTWSSFLNVMETSTPLFMAACKGAMSKR